MNKLLLSILLVVLMAHNAHAQKKKAWVKAADHAFTVEEDYYKAFKYYDAALKYKPSEDSIRLLYRLAESARLIGAPMDARDAYQQLLKAPADTLAKSPYRDIPLHLGEVEISLAYINNHFSSGGYQVAAKHFADFPDEEDERRRRGRAVIEFATEKQVLYANDLIQLESAASANGPDFSSAPWPWAPPEEALSARSKRFYPQFYLAGKNGKYYASTTGNLPVCMNTYLSHTAINQEYSRVYFTVCEGEAGALSSRCDIYYQDLDVNGLPTGERIAIPEIGTGSDESIQIQPVISWDAVREREVLYFVSNRPGGKGGMDIWKSEYDQERNRFSPPVNEAAVNTPGDEMTPFFQNEVLYFSSNGQPNRYGGFDLFSWNARLGAPENMGQKINSSADDFAYSRDSTGNRAFFVSNRQSIFLSNAELETSCSIPMSDGCCCLDTYTYEVPHCDLEIVTVSHCGCPEGSECQPLTGPGLEVWLQDITDEAAGNSSQLRFTADQVEANHYFFKDRMRPGRKYQVVGRYEHTTGGRTETIEALSKVFDFTNGQLPCANGAEQDTLPFKCKQPYLLVEVYEPDNGKLASDAQVRIVDITMGGMPAQGREPGPEASRNLPCGNDPGVNRSISGGEDMEISSPHPVILGHTYVILVETDQNDFLPARDTVTIEENDPAFCGLFCEKPVRIVLQEVTTPPTLEVFFDNARPRWDGWPGGSEDQKNISQVPYLQSLDSYKSRGGLYRSQFESGSEEDNIQKLELDIFIPNELEKKDIQMMQFVEEVKDLLCQGIQLTIQAVGCTSPKFKDTTVVEQKSFNNFLENRRVNSVKVELENQGLKPANWNQLYKFEQVWKTCERKDFNVPLAELQNQDNQKISVFSIDAAKYRRVELDVILGHTLTTTSQSP